MAKTKEAEQLKKCPFCGDTKAMKVDNYRMHVKCIDCETSKDCPHEAIQCVCCGAVMMDDSTAWNTRTPRNICNYELDDCVLTFAKRMQYKLDKNKHKECAHCGEVAIGIQPNGLGPISFVFCPNVDCVIFGLQMPLKIWNSRPLEADLLAALEENKFIQQELKAGRLYGECPKCKGKGTSGAESNYMYQCKQCGGKGVCKIKSSKP